MQRLMVAIKRVDKPILSPYQNASLKARVMRAARLKRGYDYLPSPVRKLSARLRAAAAKVILPAQVACLLKEKVMRAVEAKANALSFSPYNRHFRVATSGILLLVFAFTAVFSAPFRIPVTYAHSYLEEISGDVLVWRGGMLMDAREHQALNEGDMVVTLKDSSVTIRFLDRSVSRLGGNTGVEIKRLYGDPLNPVMTRVELFLKEGRIWAKVGNLLDDESVFEVSTQKAVAYVPKKGAFDMSEDADATKIAVFDNMVDVRAAGDSESINVKTVLAGYRAEVTSDAALPIEVEQIEENDPEMIASVLWLQSNMDKDDVYNETLAETAAADVLEAESAPVEETTVIADAEVEAQKVYFMAKYGELIKAEAMFVRGNHKDGSRMLRSFRRGVGNILAVVPALQEKDPIGTVFLKNLMKEKIALQMKDLSAFLPGDRLYPVKEEIQSIELLLTENEVERMNLRISQAENKLLEIQELLEGDKIGYVSALLNDYTNRMDQLVLTLSVADVVELQSILLDLAGQQVRQVKVLTSIESSLEGTPHTDLLAQVSALRRERMVKLLASLSEIRDRIPAEVMTGLKDVFDTYLADAGDSDVLKPEFDSLFGDAGAGALNFIQPDGSAMPSEVGMVMLNLEATPDALQQEPQNTGEKATGGPVSDTGDSQ
jgi:hypothetical protein